MHTLYFFVATSLVIAVLKFIIFYYKSKYLFLYVQDNTRI